MSLALPAVQSLDKDEISANVVFGSMIADPHPTPKGPITFLT